MLRTIGDCFAWIYKALTYKWDWRTISAALENRFTASLLIWIILVPTAAKFLEFAPDSIDVAPFNSEPSITLALRLPFNWYVLYFGGLALFCARLVYIYFCPEIIRQNNDAGEAANRGYTVQYLVDSTVEFFRNYFRDRKMTDEELDAAIRICSLLQVDTTELYAARLVRYSMRRGMGQDFFNLVSNVQIRYVHTTGAYQLGTNDGGTLIEREQLFRTLFWDLDRLTRISYRGARYTCSILLAIAVLSLLWISFEGVRYIIQSIFI